MRLSRLRLTAEAERGGGQAAAPAVLVARGYTSSTLTRPWKGADEAKKVFDALSGARKGRAPWRRPPVEIAPGLGDDAGRASSPAGVAAEEETVAGLSSPLVSPFRRHPAAPLWIARGEVHGRAAAVVGWPHAWHGPRWRGHGDKSVWTAPVHPRFSGRTA